MKSKWLKRYRLSVTIGVIIGSIVTIIGMGLIVYGLENNSKQVAEIGDTIRSIAYPITMFCFGQLAIIGAIIEIKD